MSIFGSILHKIMHHDAQPTDPAATTPQTTTTQTTTQAATPTPAGTPANAAPTPSPAAGPVDVAAVLGDMAARKGGGGNWQSSIVDLLKLLDLDSSLDARKQLADELSIHTAAPGTAEENIALHRAVMQKLAENGGKVPDSMRS